MLRDFTISSLEYLGTSNALEYLENETLTGLNSVAAMSSYAIITGFDSRCFNLFNQVLSGNGQFTASKSGYIYNFLGAVLNSTDEYGGCKISSDIHSRILEYLHKSAEIPQSDSKLIDEILLECDSAYANSDKRKINIHRIHESLPTDSVDYSYFKSEQAKLAAPENSEHISTANDQDKTATSSCKFVIAVAGILILSAIGWYFYFRRTKGI